tara:strand:- start:116 stop:403 length:288 start_codon:yes stop_codon:yes gene_type:complete
MLEKLIENDVLVKQLWHSGCQSFWHEQQDRFELVEFDEVDPIPDYGVMVWTENLISAWVVYQYYTSKDLDAIILWDMAEESQEYCVWSSAENLQV